MRATLPTPSGRCSRCTLVMLGVHSDQRSTSRMMRHTWPGEAAMSMLVVKCVTANPSYGVVAGSGAPGSRDPEKPGCVAAQDGLLVRVGQDGGVQDEIDAHR